MPVAERETTQHEDPILFRTEAARGLELGINGVDRGTATIAGAAIMQAGVVKDGRFEVDAKTLKQLVTLGNHGKLGVKVRFGHPSMSDDALGTFLGRAKNFRLDTEGGLARGDIFFDDSSFRTPSGDLGGYVLDLAKNDPSAFGMSVVVRGEREFRIKKDGTPETDADGNALPPLLRVKSFFAVDFVDAPAATNSVFGMNAQTALSAEAFQKLNELAERPDFIKRAYAFFQRSWDHMEERPAASLRAQPKEASMPEDKSNVCHTLEELTTQYPSLTQQMSEQGRKEGVEAERARCAAIVECAGTMPCDVKTELLSAVKDGATPEKAEAAFLRVELSERGRERNRPTGLGGDSLPEPDQFSTYEQAWRAIKSAEACSTQEAMRRAQDRYPKLHEQFLEHCPRHKK